MHLKQKLFFSLIKSKNRRETKKQIIFALYIMYSPDQKQFCPLWVYCNPAIGGQEQGIVGLLSLTTRTHAEIAIDYMDTMAA